MPLCGRRFRGRPTGLRQGQGNSSKASVDYSNDGLDDIIIQYRQHANSEPKRMNVNGTDTWMVPEAFRNTNVNGAHRPARLPRGRPRQEQSHMSTVAGGPALFLAGNGHEKQGVRRR